MLTYEKLYAIARDVLHIMSLRGIVFREDPVAVFKAAKHGAMLVILSRNDSELRFWIGANGRIDLDKLYKRLKEWA